MRWVEVWASLYVLAVLLAPRSVCAQGATDDRLQLMHEPFSYTDVIDAVDERDKFDLNAHLDYARTRETSDIYRERTVDGRRVSEHVANAQRVVSQVVPGVDVGLYRDIMAFMRMPLILSDARELKLPSDVPASAGSARLSDATGQGGNVNALFGLPFASPTRAGLDYIAFGGAWAPYNQTRKAWHPTWLLRIEGRRAVGRTLRACGRVRDANGASCGTESTEDRDGDGKLDGTRSGTRAGSSRGVSALLLETRFSHRYRRAEPYAGLSVLVEWASTAKDVFRQAGYGHARPGPQTGAVLGLALIPWEDRAMYQRIVIDLRGVATHVARGTDYTPLFDALGTSSDPSLARSRDGVQFWGVTEVQSYLRYGAQLGVEIQAARYVRFSLGSLLQWSTSHALTGREACNGPSSAVAAPVSDDGRACPSGRADKRERDVIDAPGRRFIMRNQFLLGAYATATASF